MRHLNTNLRLAVSPLAVAVMLVVALLLTGAAQAATPGITGVVSGTTTTFRLVAAPSFISQPDGAQIYSWGYGCATGFTPTYAPAAFATLGFCPTMQVPGPTLVVTEGQSVTVTLTNNLPGGANASIVFPGFTVTAACSSGTCSPGLHTLEAALNGTVSYTFTATTPGTRAYFSGTQPDLQVEMGLYGAIVVLPAHAPGSGTGQCSSLGSDTGQKLGAGNSGDDFRLSSAAYDHPETCYDREYLFQFMELDARIHRQAEEQVQAMAACLAAPVAGILCPTSLNVKTEPYHPSYFMINGRSMPDDMDPDYAPNYPHQPYNGNPHMHPGDLVLVRTIGQGHWEHPFHEHGNHVRILARDGNLILSQNDPNAGPTGTGPTARLAGRMEFTTDTYPGQSYDGIYYWSGRGLGWDIYGHTPANGAINPPCNPGTPGTVNYGFDTTTLAVTNGNYFEWCADHNHPLEANPVGQIGAGGPATQFDPQIASAGLWYNGTPYLGQDAVTRSAGVTPLPPSKSTMNTLPESGISFMWHSHNEREITTNDIFPGGMLMMMLVDPPVWFIDETL
jgi:FtsP/CotA-like multicopper oxidase with cupredoxin domain